jgi:hypothetical protein
MILSNLLKRSSNFVSDNSPVILTATAVAGVLTTAILSGRAAVKAADILRVEEAYRELDFEPSLKEQLELTWKCYIPPVLVASSTIAAIIGATHISSRRTATALGLYSLTDTAFREYKDKVVEQIGAGKEQKVRDSVAQDRVKAIPPSNEIIIIEGEVLCCELWTMRYFKSTQEKIRRAENDINAEINNNMYASLTDFYNLIGLPSTAESDNVGWNIDRRLDIQFTTILSEGKPMLALCYDKAPTMDFHKVY